MDRLSTAKVGLQLFLLFHEFDDDHLCYKVFGNGKTSIHNLSTLARDALVSKGIGQGILTYICD